MCLSCTDYTLTLPIKQTLFPGTFLNTLIFYQITHYLSQGNSFCLQTTDQFRYCNQCRKCISMFDGTTAEFYRRS